MQNPARWYFRQIAFTAAFLVAVFPALGAETPDYETADKIREQQFSAASKLAAKDSPVRRLIDEANYSMGNLAGGSQDENYIITSIVLQPACKDGGSGNLIKARSLSPDETRNKVCTHVYVRSLGADADEQLLGRTIWVCVVYPKNGDPCMDDDKTGEN